ncbi:HD domain-containing protein [Mucilaginibacter sp. CAU 1740]|uniref:HD domain-containing protein n=1 Tax=Mucilaginibacter sp. CAU 1740 TaxID=3140365 RepID=UPI00325B670C
MPAINIVQKAAAYVKMLLKNGLPANMYFHNLQHTQHVVNAAIEIAKQSGLNRDQTTIVKIAAWFHDTGYLYQYKGHEDTSIVIAGTFLMQHHYGNDFIQQVWDCIEATKVPQLPNNLTQQVICDADMSHFADTNYQDFAGRLKQEWEARLDKRYADNEWHDMNLHILQHHQYFTDYGKTVLQPLKQKNIELLQGQMA